MKYGAAIYVSVACSLIQHVSAVPAGNKPISDDNPVPAHLNLPIKSRSPYNRHDLYIYDIITTGLDSVVGTAIFKNTPATIKCGHDPNENMNEMRVYNKIMEAQRANPKDGKYVVDLLDAFPINTLNNDGNSLLYSLPPQVQNDPELMKSCCFITRLAGHKNLLQYNEELPVQNKNLHLLSVMIQVLKGTKFLNDAGVIHGDLRPENIMIETMENGAPKATLINFTSSLVFDVNSKVALTSRTIIGSSQYAPFEALASQTYDLLRSETWKIGAAFYHSLAGMTLYKKVTNGAYFLSMAKRAKHFAAILRDSSFTLPPVTNDQALMQQCRLLLQQLDILLTVGQHRMTPKEALAAIAKNLINVKLGH